MEELLEELGDKVISITKRKSQPDLVVIDGNKTSPKEIRLLRRAFDEEEIQYNLTVKGSGYGT